MKAIAYSIKNNDKELLVMANAKQHELTLISNELNLQTFVYARGKQVVIISALDILDARLLTELYNSGVRYIITRSRGTTHIDLNHATRIGLKIANTPGEDQSPEGIASQAIRNLSQWEAGKCVGTACCCQKACTNTASITHH